MAFKIGSSTVIDNSRNVSTGSSNSGYTGVSGFFDGAGYRLDALTRYFTATDVKADNCRGYLPAGNCAGNLQYNVPNGNWWTWGIAGVPTTNCLNPNGYDFAGGRSSAFYSVSVNYVYDSYYELYSRVGSGDRYRNYSHCNCVSGLNGVGNCYNNCNCNCACDCDCNCACNC